MNVFNPKIIFEDNESDENKSKILNIIHFNDVYNIESNTQEPIGGASRFINVIENIINQKPTIVFFSGDALSPSNISMLVKGKQMIEVLNKCHIAASCLGNHDFDFGLDVLINHISDSNFPWLLSNVFDVETKKPLGNVENKKIIEFNGIKIGVIALVEEEWITTLSTISYDEIIYKSYVEIGKELAIELKTKENCDIVIALTHMRWNNDRNLAEQVPEIDLFLGGHDHDYGVSLINNRWVIKSGTDFREFSLIELNDNKIKKIEKYTITSEIEENPEIKSLVDSYMKDLNKELEVVLGYMNVELEGRFSCVRTMETNLGNFVADILLASVHADCAMLNSGSFRSDVKHEKGEFKMRDLKKILPYLDESVVLLVKGDKLLKAIENSVSQYPKHEGRFCQVAGMRFAFDPSKPSGNRVDPRFVQIQDEDLDLSKEYMVVTKSYMKLGKDGFDAFLDCPVLVDEENIPVLFSLVANHFKSITKLRSGDNRFRQSIVPLITVNRLINNLSQDPEIIKKKIEQSPSKLGHKINFKNAVQLVSKMLTLYKFSSISRKERLLIKESEQYKQKIKEYEEKSMKLEPMVENRIICIKNEQHYQDIVDLFRNKLSLSSN